jgi:ketosteroid isomerase-like protein
MEPEGNLETIRSIAERWNAGDVDGLLDVFDDDVVVVTSPSWPEQADVRGKEAVRAWMEDWRSLWQFSEVHEFELRANGDKVAARGAWETRGRASGVEGSWPFSQVYTLSDGKIVRFEWFDEYEDALRAAGLEEGA